MARHNDIKRRSFLGAVSTRNQILGAFLLAMILVISTAQYFTYRTVSHLLQTQAENSARKVAVQMSGRFDAALHEVNIVSLRVAVDASIQGALMKYADKGNLDYEDYRNVAEELRRNIPFMGAVESVEIFEAQSGKSIADISGLTISDIVNHGAILLADEAAGALVWLGDDPRNADTLIALRQIRLLDRGFEGGGYLLVRVGRELFSFVDRDFPDIEEGDIRVLSENGILIATNDRRFSEHTGTSAENDYISVRTKSAETGWIVEIRIPIAQVMAGLDPLRRSVLLSGIIGLLVSIAAGVFLSQLITVPIRRLTAVMERNVHDRLGINRETYSNLEINELNRIYNEMAERINTLIASVYEKELERSRAELKAIQARINPHFLHNTLEAFYWTLVEKGEEELAARIIALSDLFRYTIRSDGNADLVPLSDEMHHVRLYAELMRFRLNERIEFRIELDERFAALPVPKLTLQPVVENAVRHGLEGRVGSGFVRIGTRPAPEKDAVLIEIKDDGIGIPAEKLTELRTSFEKPEPEYGDSGIGLRNVFRRLSYLLGPKAHLDIESAKNTGTLVTIRIPFTEYGNGK